MLPKMRKEEYFRKSSINPESRIKQEKRESLEKKKNSEKKESQKKRKNKERQSKEKKGKYVHSWVTYSHKSPSQVTCSTGQH